MAPAIPLFLWRETGPIAWYLEQGYAYVHMDTRGTGRSGGEFRYQDKREQRDLYEVVEWIAAQRWSNGKVGGIGQSYFARSQWFMATQNPPHLGCVAPYDGHIDTYRDSAYTGGIPGGYPTSWWEQVRTVNAYPNAGKKRFVDYDYPAQVKKHPTYDAFWRERSAAEKLAKIKAPVFSIGVWSKVDLHLNGNIVGFQRAGGPKKLLVFGSSDLYAAVADYSSIAFHEKYLLPFYDCYLKGKRTSYLDEPDVRYFVTGGDRFETAPSWPPAQARYVALLFGSGSDRQRRLAERRHAVRRCADGSGRCDGLRLSECRLAARRRRRRQGRTSRSGAPRADLHDAAARSGSRGRRPDRADPSCRFEPQRHRFLREAVGADAAKRRRPTGRYPAAFAHRHQGLAAGFDARDRQEAVAAARAALQPHQATDADARTGFTNSRSR